MSSNPSPYWPIIYVRGYAMTSSEIDETTADPFCGFNLGSTVYRAVPDKNKPPRKFVFESPVIRLASEFGYQDVYEDGYDIMDSDWGKNPTRTISTQSIIIYRYYDEASSLLGVGQTPSIDVFAVKLGELIDKVRELVCSNSKNDISTDDFRCYLVAHSMGGLVCRAFLQNSQNDPKNMKRHVSKFFTYATPHNGIEVGGVNVPSWLTANDINNFNRTNMARYLNMETIFEKTKRVDWLHSESFPVENVFTMIGTNRSDYEVAMGLSRTFVGFGSDGLVRIDNASLNEINDDYTIGEPCAKAFVYRSHSGYFGIVNSEEAYQNLIRFLFGDVRVDVWADIESLRLPGEVQTAVDKGKEVNALYQIEMIAAVRGKLWYLTRRTSEEDSAACFSYKDWYSSNNSIKKHLSTIFLANRAKVNSENPSLAYSVMFGVRIPDYMIENVFWINEHFEGGSIFKNEIVLELISPSTTNEPWRIEYRWKDQVEKKSYQLFDTSILKNGKIEFSVPFANTNTPGINGKIRFVISRWNEIK